MLTSIIYRATLNRNGRENREGLRTVVISVYQTGSRERVCINTHVRVRKEDFRCGKVQESEPNHDLYNTKIRRRIRRLMEYEDEIESRGQQPTPRMIREAAERHVSRTATLQEFVAAVIDTSGRYERDYGSRGERLRLAMREITAPNIFPRRDKRPVFTFYRQYLPPEVVSRGR